MQRNYNFVILTRKTATVVVPIRTGKLWPALFYRTFVAFWFSFKIIKIFLQKSFFWLRRRGGGRRGGPAGGLLLQFQHVVHHLVMQQNQPVVDFLLGGPVQATQTCSLSSLSFRMTPIYSEHISETADKDNIYFHPAIHCLICTYPVLTEQDTPSATLVSTSYISTGIFCISLTDWYFQTRKTESDKKQISFRRGKFAD